MSTGNAQPVSMSSSSSGQQITIYLNPAGQQTSNDQHHPHIHHQQSSDHHQLRPPRIGSNAGDEYEIVQMQPVSSTDLQPQTHFIHVTNHNTITTTTNSATLTAEAANINAPINTISTSTMAEQNQNTNLKEECESNQEQHDQQDQDQQNSHSATRFKWTEEKSQVAMNLVKFGCKPKLISVAVGCSLRTAQKFAETVSPKIEGESFKAYQIKRRGRKSKDVNQRLNAIKEVLSKDSNRTQVEIAADLKVSNTTVCRDLKRLGASWKTKRNGNVSLNTSGIDSTLENNDTHEQSNNKQQASSTTPQNTTTKRTRQSNSKSQKNTNDTRGANKTKKNTRQKKRNIKTNDSPQQNNNTISDPNSGQNQQTAGSNNDSVHQ